MLKRVLLFFLIVTGCFFVATCEKDLIPVPADQVYDTSNHYLQVQAPPDILYCDSIEIVECHPRYPADEVPDLFFCFRIDSNEFDAISDNPCEGCENSFDQLLTNLDGSDLPTMLIPATQWKFDGLTENSVITVKALDFDSFSEFPCSDYQDFDDNEKLAKFTLHFSDLLRLQNRGFGSVTLKSMYIVFRLYFRVAHA